MSHGLALITGASSGIGTAFAQSLPEATDLILTGRDRVALGTLAAEVAREGRRVETVVADLGNDAGREALVQAVAARPIDLLINNAGLGRFGALIDNPPEVEREMLEVNVLAPTLLTRALLPGMIERARADRRRAGVIVVASTASFAPLPFLNTYAATKAYDRFFAEGLAGELKRQPVDVLALCPGPTRTNFLVRARGDGMDRSNAVDPLVVAQEGLRALGRRTVHVVGGGNQVYAALTRVVPSRLLRDAAGSYIRRVVKRSQPT